MAELHAKTAVGDEGTTLPRHFPLQSFQVRAVNQSSIHTEPSDFAARPRSASATFERRAWARLFPPLRVYNAGAENHLHYVHKEGATRCRTIDAVGDAAARVGVVVTELAGGRYSCSTRLCISTEQSLSDIQRPTKGMSAAVAYTFLAHTARFSMDNQTMSLN